MNAVSGTRLLHKRPWLLLAAVAGLFCVAGVAADVPHDAAATALALAASRRQRRSGCNGVALLRAAERGAACAMRLDGAAWREEELALLATDRGVADAITMCAVELCGG